MNNVAATRPIQVRIIRPPRPDPDNSAPGPQAAEASLSREEAKALVLSAAEDAKRAPAMTASIFTALCQKLARIENTHTKVWTLEDANIEIVKLVSSETISREEGLAIEAAAIKPHMAPYHLLREFNGWDYAAASNTTIDNSLVDDGLKFVNNIMTLPLESDRRWFLNTLTASFDSLIDQGVVTRDAAAPLWAAINEARREIASPTMLCCTVS